MTTFTETAHPTEGIVSDAGMRSRDAVTIGASQTLLPGAVLGIITASGQHVALNPAAADGSQTAAAIALYPATTGAGATAVIAALTRECEFRKSSLIFAGGIDAAAQATAIAQLATRHIIVRD